MPHTKLKAYIQKAHNFALPESGDVPIIMVGPGTGVAPFRAFLQERRVTQAAGGAWLFFGHRRRAADFFYEEEFGGMLKDGSLSKLSLAWSRDGDTKTYVQDNDAHGERGPLRWIARGAHFYVCGDAKRMAGDVERALAEIIATHGDTYRAFGEGLIVSMKRPPLSDGCLLMATRLPSARPVLIAALDAACHRDGGSVMAASPLGRPGASHRILAGYAPKGAALGETLGTRHAASSSDGGWCACHWDRALIYIAAGFKQCAAEMDRMRSASISPGQLLTEDYYIANKLMKGFIGSANVDTNSRLCMASSVAGHKRVFGSDTVPGCYEDLDEADLFVLVGSNAAWCHPVLYQRMVAAQEKRGAKLVDIDPRATAHPRPRLCNSPWRRARTVFIFGPSSSISPEQSSQSGFHRGAYGRLRGSARLREEIAPNLSAISLRTRLPPEDISRFYELWARTERVVTLYSQASISPCRARIR